MATATSTVAAAISAVLAAINTQPAVGTFPTLVKKGAPGPNVPDDLVIVGERVRQEYTPHHMRGDGGSGFLQERYRISVVVDCYRGGDDPDQALTRCETLVNAVDDSVRDDPSLGGVVILAYPAQHSYTLDWEPDHKGWIARCEIEVECLAEP
jgi:hypothetical protein